MTAVHIRNLSSTKVFLLRFLWPSTSLRNATVCMSEEEEGRSEVCVCVCLSVCLSTHPADNEGHDSCQHVVSCQHVCCGKDQQLQLEQAPLPPIEQQAVKRVGGVLVEEGAVQRVVELHVQDPFQQELPLGNIVQVSETLGEERGGVKGGGEGRG